MGIRVTEAKRGMVIRHEGELFQIAKYNHVTPGKGRAINHLLLRGLKSGRQKELRMSSGDTIEPVFMESRACQYLYKDGNGHVFMDNENYEQFHLPLDMIEDAMKYIPENASVDVLFCEGDASSVQLPAAAVLEVIDAEDAVRGDTATNVQKNVTLNTGLVIKAPLHIKIGEKVKVATDTGDFLSRA
ncbi:MAG: elongation factor P [Planctomycetaceae bacterium]|nr:elongation factor P [Planctomycetaceae bacterium]